MKAGGSRPAGPSANQIAALLGTRNRKKKKGAGGWLRAEVRLSAVLTCVASAAPSGAENHPKEEKEKIMYKKNVGGS